MLRSMYLLLNYHKVLSYKEYPKKKKILFMNTEPLVQLLFYIKLEM